jgi:hypothetical protein
MKDFDLELFLRGKQAWDSGKRVSEMDREDRAAVAYYRDDGGRGTRFDAAMREALAAEILRLRALLEER